MPFCWHTKSLVRAIYSHRHRQLTCKTSILLLPAFLHIPAHRNPKLYRINVTHPPAMPQIFPTNTLSLEIPQLNCPLIQHNSLQRDCRRGRCVLFGAPPAALSSHEMWLPPRVKPVITISVSVTVICIARRGRPVRPPLSAR